MTYLNTMKKEKRTEETSLCSKNIRIHHQLLCLTALAGICSSGGKSTLSVPNNGIIQVRSGLT